MCGTVNRQHADVYEGHFPSRTHDCIVGMAKNIENNAISESLSIDSMYAGIGDAVVGKGACRQSSDTMPGQRENGHARGVTGNTEPNEASKKSFSQPRDPKTGRFVPRRATLVIDEVGDISVSSKPRKGRNPPSRTFSHVVSIVEDLEAFAKVSRDYKKVSNISGELKARKRDLPHKILLGMRIRETGAIAYGYTVDKDWETPRGWDDISRVKVQRALLEEAIAKTITRTRRVEYDVVIDRHEIHGGDRIVRAILDNIEDRFNGVKIEGGECSSKNRAKGALIETNDLVANAVFESVEKGENRPAEAVGVKIRKYRFKDVLRIGK